jgi:hypothetical protein
MKATAVPHAAITIAITRMIQSNGLALPSIAIFAQIGPMTQIKNAENDPRNAMTDSNSGIAMETTTDRKVVKTRRHTRVTPVDDSEIDSLFVRLPCVSSDALRPTNVSIVAFN